MSRYGDGARGAIPWMLVLLATVGSGPAGADGAWVPVSVDDPSTGRPVELKAGPQALHLVLFATWCPVCLDELEELAELESRWGPHGYRLVLVAVATRHTPARLARFVEQRQPPGRLLLDSERLVERALDASGLPTHVLLDSSGREVLRATALDAGVREEIEQLVRPRRGRRGG